MHSHPISRTREDREEAHNNITPQYLFQDIAADWQTQRYRCGECTAIQFTVPARIERRHTTASHHNILFKTLPPTGKRNAIDVENAQPSNFPYPRGSRGGTQLHHTTISFSRHCRRLANATVVRSHSVKKKKKQKTTLSLSLSLSFSLQTHL